MITQKNYTSKMEAEMRENSPITYDVAVVLAERFGKKLRSVIAKACSMNDVEYIAKERRTKKGETIVSKSALVSQISDSLNGVDLVGLEKATKTSLETLLKEIS